MYIPGDDIDAHFANKDVAHVNALPMELEGNKYHMFAMKEPDYTMKIMSTYGNLEELTGADTRQTYKSVDGEMMMKTFKYTKVFGNHFRYHHQVDDHNSHCHAPISIETTWKTKYWPDQNFAHFLAVSEVNMNLVRDDLIRDAEVFPQLAF